MKKKNGIIDSKTDLRHDNMEFNANENELPVEQMSNMDVYKEEDEEDITAEELNNLEEDDTDSQAYALDSVESDLQEDEDILPEEDWTDDLPDNEDDDPEKEYQRNK
jgi:hypothetical protein